MIDKKHRVVWYPIQAAAAQNHHELQAKKNTTQRTGGGFFTIHGIVLSGFIKEHGKK